MADLITVLARQTGFESGTIRKGLGALLKFLEGHLDPDTFQKVQAAVPGAAEMVAAFDAEKGSAGGLFSTVAGLAGNLLGGRSGEGANLLAMLSRAGLDVHQIEAFLPRAFEQLGGILPPDRLEQVRALVAAVAPDASVATP